MSITLMEATRNAACNAVVDLIDVGSATTSALIMYTAADVLLVQVTLPNPAFGAASVGVATAQGLPLVAVASAAGTLAKYKIFDRNSTLLWRGTIGTSAADMIVDSTSIALGQAISITSWTHTQPV